jgi:two-component system sensor histidine kinase KdpD
MRDHIFEKFTQVAGKQRKGTGLGLAFCKLVTEAHHGQIGVRENPKGGSIFWIKIPAAMPDQSCPVDPQLASSAW